MVWLWVVLLIVVIAAGWVLTLLGLPGTWLIVAGAAGYVALGPEAGVVALGWTTVVALLVMAVVGEVLEFLAGALGAAQGGGSKRSAGLALLMSAIFGVVGLLVGAPIPVIGSLVAAVLLAAVGAMIGAVIGERWKGRDWRPSWQVGKSAFWGRLLGTAAKVGVATGMAVLAVVALLL
jgi:hypothetical protein